MPDTAILILFVEDEPLIRLALQDALERAGFTVLTASTASDAINNLDHKNDEIRALITDIRLGGEVSGWKVARYARQLNPDLPIVYTSGDSGADWAVEGVPKSIMVQKPYADAQIVTALAGLLNIGG